MTPEEAKIVARYINDHAALLPRGRSRLASHLHEAANSIEAAAAPAQPAAVEPRCERCRWWDLLGRYGVNGSYGFCWRYPPLEKDRKAGELCGVFPTTTGIQRCGEFAPREVTP